MLRKFSLEGLLLAGGRENFGFLVSLKQNFWIWIRPYGSNLRTWLPSTSAAMSTAVR